MCYMELEICSPWKGKTDIESIEMLAPEIKRKGMPADCASGHRKEEEKVMEETGAATGCLL